MKRAFLAMLLVSAGCRFSLRSIDAGDGDVADFGVTDDLADVASIDLATADLTAVVQDMTLDPCGTAPALGNGNVAAQCVIGSPPTVDGNLADWPPSLFSPLTHSTPGVTTDAPGSAWSGSAATDDADLSARWAARWDLTNLYLAVSVVDDVRKTPNTIALTDNDSIELFFDGKHDRTVAYGADDWQLAYSADGKTGTYQDGTATPLPAGVTVQKAFGGTSPNYTLEIAVPWALLGAMPPVTGRVVGFDLKLDDNDGGTSMRDRDLILFYTAGNSGSCSAPYCRTDAFGAVQLQGR